MSPARQLTRVPVTASPGGEGFLAAWPPPLLGCLWRLRAPRASAAPQSARGCRAFYEPAPEVPSWHPHSPPREQSQAHPRSKGRDGEPPVQQEGGGRVPGLSSHLEAAQGRLVTPRSVTSSDTAGARGYGNSAESTQFSLRRFQKEGVGPPAGSGGPSPPLPAPTAEDQGLGRVFLRAAPLDPGPHTCRPSRPGRRPGLWAAPCCVPSPASQTSFHRGVWRD